MERPHLLCVTCQQRVTDSDWLPHCCEICFDSDTADAMRFFDRWNAAGAGLSGRPERPPG